MLSYAHEIILFARYIWTIYVSREDAVFKGEYPCICIQARGRWKWQRLDKLSQNKFHEHRKALSQQIFSVENDEQLHLLPIEIRAAYGENIVVQDRRQLNGRWLPQDERKMACRGEYQIYKHEKYDRWLYQVGNGDWWIGTQANMNQRKPWGFARPNPTHPAGAAFSGCPPWEVPLWKVWARSTGQAEMWHESGMNIVVLSNKHCAQKEMDEKVKKMETQFVSQLSAATQKCEIYSKAMHLLFNDLTREKRLEMISSPVFGDLFKVEQLCSGCLCKPEQIIKCVHFDCPGACQACHDLHDTDTICGACGKDQYMVCPICIEKYLPDFMNILPCKHAVCWKCTCRGYETKKPLKKCPICRNKFPIK